MREDHVTVIAFIRADGYCAPPFFIFQSKSAIVHNQWIEGIDGAGCAVSLNGYLNDQVWTLVVAHIVGFIEKVQSKKENRRTSLIYVIM